MSTVDQRRRNAVAGAGKRRRRFTWSALLWSLVYPRRRQRITPTLSGLVLIGLSFGLGTAAYNAANNILFITLSLLLACLVLSGVMSWANLRGVAWRLQVSAPLRAGQTAQVTLGVRNGKRIVPTYGLAFELVARGVEPGPPARAETTFTAKGVDVRAALATADRAEARGRVALAGRIDPGDEASLEWVFQPRRRGRLRVELDGVVSLFPFGFLRKRFTTEVAEEVVVWPAPVEYRRLGGAARPRPTGGGRVARIGGGSDLLALRRYAAGDSHRLIHWKASARMRELLVRQFAAEQTEGFAVWLRTDAAMWARPEQFELLVGLAATLAEDLFRAGQLTTVAIDGEPPRPVRRVRDLETWLDRLAVVAVGGEGPTAGAQAEKLRAEMAGDGTRPPGAVAVVGSRNLVTFAPDGPRGVVAFCHGNCIATV